MAPEYYSTGKVSTRTDTYAFGIILLKLLTDQPSAELAKLLYQDPDFHAMLSTHAFSLQCMQAAGKWPRKAAGVLGVVASRCVHYSPGKRARVRDVLPQVQALFSAAQ
jgi:serine/threonine protein kinase